MRSKSLSAGFVERRDSAVKLDANDVQSPLSRTFELPRTNQYAHERATREDVGYTRQVDSHGDYRTADECCNGHLGNELVSLGIVVR